MRLNTLTSLPWRTLFRRLDSRPTQFGQTIQWLSATFVYKGTVIVNGKKIYYLYLKSFQIKTFKWDGWIYWLSVNILYEGLLTQAFHITVMFREIHARHVRGKVCPICTYIVPICSPDWTEKQVQDFLIFVDFGNILVLFCALCGLFRCTGPRDH